MPVGVIVGIVFGISGVVAVGIISICVWIFNARLRQRTATTIVASKTVDKILAGEDAHAEPYSNTIFIDCAAMLKMWDYKRAYVCLGLPLYNS